MGRRVAVVEPEHQRQGSNSVAMAAEKWRQWRQWRPHNRQRAVGRQDIGGGGSSRAVAAEAAWQQQHLHEGGGRVVAGEAAWQWQRLYEDRGSSAEAVAGQQGSGRSAEAAGWC